MILALALAAVTCSAPYVVDGDTLQCGPERVRLFGVDAPELAHGGRPAQPGAVEARRMLERITSGRVRCEEAGNGRDRYGRLVARCTAPGVGDVAAALARAGWARDYPHFSHGRYAADEAAARAARRGVWRAR